MQRTTMAHIGPQTPEVTGGLPVDRSPKDIRCPEQRMASRREPASGSFDFSRAAYSEA
jgi:hypothetical protein